MRCFVCEQKERGIWPTFLADTMCSSENGESKTPIVGTMCSSENGEPKTLSWNYVLEQKMESQRLLANIMCSSKNEGRKLPS